MPYKLEIKPFIKKEGWKYKVVSITDITLHTSHKQPSSIGKTIKKAFQSMKPGRIYGSISYAKPTSSPENKTAVIDLINQDPEFIKMVKEEEKSGYKVLLELPNEIPIVAGKDTIEFITSVNGKRILRGLAKNNPSN